MLASSARCCASATPMCTRCAPTRRSTTTSWSARHASCACGLEASAPEQALEEALEAVFRALGLAWLRRPGDQAWVDGLVVHAQLLQEAARGPFAVAPARFGAHHAFGHGHLRNGLLGQGRAHELDPGGQGQRRA